MSTHHARKLGLFYHEVFTLRQVKRYNIDSKGAGSLLGTDPPQWTPKEVSSMATKLEITTDRHGLRIVSDSASPWLSPVSFIRCPKCNGSDPDCDLCVSETPVAKIWHHLRTSAQVDLLALYSELDAERRRARI